ncbi:hypothetical protein GF325_00355 [Candidatus Bathyarchaeota archaeon]|nr:hypothetical protein [Candidatus Bathyarchaeota archaeon]
MGLLQLTKDPGKNTVGLPQLKDFILEHEMEESDLDKLLEIISTGSDGAILVLRGKEIPQVRILDKINLYLMLLKLDYSMASADLLHWQDFEALVEYALEEHGFLTEKNYRFKDARGKRHEIDVLAIDKLSKEHLIFLLDAKHWNYKTNSSATRILDAAKDQFKRTEALGKTKGALSQLFFKKNLEWSHAILIPGVVTLLAPPVQDFFIPIVSILSFNNFIQEFSENLDYFKKKHVRGIPTQKRLVS